jgi:hypothetical protein
MLFLTGPERKASSEHEKKYYPQGGDFFFGGEACAFRFRKPVTLLYVLVFVSIIDGQLCVELHSRTFLTLG